ncbi:MAG: AAA family ATPase [Sediminibacterium sp.]|jgi:predicted ATPase|uniref:AAA family ATPase n=1 Tax=Sediminibacterium sp. TaxID=1917865 RepID=UPI002ABCF758|nr:AAA family ATPase [Sediminibacterium sp.]MDZ4073087.1 AAA family ATPase [Sediminibacterium sp.]
MNIISLYIEDYKLLKKFTVNFQKDITILIGVNGSGKSTILECIAQIFSDVFLRQPSKFGFRLEYQLQLEETFSQTSVTAESKVRHITVHLFSDQSNETIGVRVLEGETVLEKEQEIEKHFGSLEIILPSNIVIYYSGQTEIMKQLCLPHDEKLSSSFRKWETDVPRPFFYFEPALFEIILLTLLSYEFGEIPYFLQQRAKIDGVHNIQIILKKPTWAKDKIDNWWGAKGEVKTFLDYLDQLSQPLMIEKDEQQSTGNVAIEAWQNDSLIITIIGQEKLFEIRDYFREEKTFFKVLNTLYIDGFAPEIKFSLIAYTESQSTGYFSILSEGEQQAITIRGLVELVTNKNTLFLFDEPDTYLHPSWQRNFIEDINSLFVKNEHTTSQFLITTHSPQLLSNADPERSDVQIMEDGEIVKITPKYYGRDISTILYEMMGVERRNQKIAKLLSVLFNYIEDEDLLNSKKEYLRLIEILGEDDPAIIRAKTQLDYLQESKNEENK